MIGSVIDSVQQTRTSHTRASEDSRVQIRLLLFVRFMIVAKKAITSHSTNVQVLPRTYIMGKIALCLPFNRWNHSFNK